jgi:hypothetical protein
MEGLLIDTENDHLGGRIHIKADNISGLLRKIGIVAFAPGFAGQKIDLVVPQAAPDILNVDIAQRLGQQRPRPPGEPLGRRLVQQFPLVGRLRVERFLAGVRFVLKPCEPVVGIAMSPMADYPRLNPDFLRNRPGTPALRRQQNNPRSLQITLHRTRRTAASLKLLAVAPRKSNFSCIGNHPDLESRLTSQKKWVLGRLPC